MIFKKVLLIGGIATIPAWYAYRTLSEHRDSHLTLNDVFMTEPERLTKEFESEKKKAQDDLEKLKKEYSVEATRQRSASEIRACIEFSKKVRTDFDAFAEEEKRWKSEVEPLLHTGAGAAIVGNEDYVRAFKEFYISREPEESLKASAAEIDGISQKCEESRKKDPLDFSFSSEKSRLEELERRFTNALASGIGFRRKIQLLAQIASGQAPPTVEAAIERQRIKEMVEDYRKQRDEVKLFGRRLQP